MPVFGVFCCVLYFISCLKCFSVQSAFGVSFSACQRAITRDEPQAPQAHSTTYCTYISASYEHRGVSSDTITSALTRPLYHTGYLLVVSYSYYILYISLGRLWASRIEQHDDTSAWLDYHTDIFSYTLDIRVNVCWLVSFTGMCSYKVFFFFLACWVFFLCTAFYENKKRS